MVNGYSSASNSVLALFTKPSREYLQFNPDIAHDLRCTYIVVFTCIVVIVGGGGETYPKLPKKISLQPQTAGAICMGSTVLDAVELPSS